MSKIISVGLVILCCFSLSLASIASADSPSKIFLPVVINQSKINVWTASPADKIQPTTHAGTGTTIAMEGALGSYESYQLVVSASSPLTGINASASELIDGSGHRILAANLTFFREEFIDFTGVVENEPGNQPVPK